MKKQLLTLLLASSEVLFGQEQNLCRTNLFFEKGSYSFTESALETLDSLVDQLNDPSEELLLVGHTDSDANVEFNLILAQNRAREVQNYLLIREKYNRIHIETKGEAVPVNGNNNEDEKRMNRRVEIIRNYHNSNEFENRFKKAPQTFLIDASRDTLIQCAEGTKLFIPAGSFVTKDVNAVVELKVSEFYNKSDFLLNNLTTTTITDEILESGGTINIEASSCGEKLKLNALATLEVEFKGRKPDDGMEAYYACKAGDITKWSTDLPLNEERLDSIPLLITIKTKNLDTLEVITEALKNVDGIVYKEITTKRRCIASDPYVTDVKRLPSSEVDLVQAMLYDPNIKIPPTFKPAPVIPRPINPRLFYIRTLGDCNCDRVRRRSPINDQEVEPMITSRTLEVTIDKDVVPSVSLVFDGVNTILPYSRRENNVYYFDNVPLEQNFDVLAVYADKNGLMMAKAMNKVIPKDGSAEVVKIPLALTKCTEQDIYATVKRIDD